jgi:hypothetical protein
MIDNILDLIKAATSVGTATGAGATIDVSEVVANLHPLGLLDAGTMKTILAFTNLGETRTCACARTRACARASCHSWAGGGEEGEVCMPAAGPSVTRAP